MKVALLGFGTVGKGVYQMLTETPSLTAGPVLVRPEKATEPWMVSQIQQITNDPSIEVVVEAMGGIQPALSYVKSALQSGKHVVTANKALIAAHGLELASIAEANRVGLLFSAACGGGVPLLHNLSLATATDSIESVSGILNGTTNFMLDAMQRQNLRYEESLAIAQQLGYAESDPTADVSGMDALRKLVLACAVAFERFPQEGLLCEGIQSFTAEDVADIQSRGFTCRLLAKSALVDGQLSAYVEPTLLPHGAAECNVFSNYNLVRYHGAYCGDLIFIGQGAGRFPTASAILRDISTLRLGHTQMLRPGCTAVAVDNSSAVHSYYVRMPQEVDIPLRFRSVVDGICRGITSPISVLTMHQLVNRLREQGQSIFFAGIEEAVL